MSARKWSCCGTTYTHSDTVGCCGACGRVFSGLAAFDRHQVGPRNERGRLACIDPETATRKDGNPLFEAHPDSVGDKPLWRMWKTEEARDAGKVFVESRRTAPESGRRAESPALAGVPGVPVTPHPLNAPDNAEWRHCDMCPYVGCPGCPAKGGHP